MRRALLSVSDKTGIVELGRGLASRGFELVSTGGTAKALAGAGLEVTSVADVTGFPEMMDGRVKTLHPLIHGGLLARRDHPADLDAAKSHGIGLIDVVVVNLYPFEETAKKPGVSFEELVEQIDIGGPSLVRAAAKNFRDVLVVVDSGDYARLLKELDGTPSLAFRYEMMRKAIAHTGAYDTAIGETLAAIDLVGDRFERTSLRAGGAAAGKALDERIDVALEKIRDLRYGENPHQKAAWYAAEAPRSAGEGARGLSRAHGFGDASILQGKDLSYTNLLDLDAAARIVLEFSEPAAVVIKHTNPCGAAIGATTAEAYVHARDADSLAAYGGIVALNRPLDAVTAQAIVSTFIEAVVAPSVDDAARPILARKANMRVVTADFSTLGGLEMRSILGAVLVQDRDRVLEAHEKWGPQSARAASTIRVVTKRQPTSEEWEALQFAWRICAHVKSNAVIFTDASRTLAIGAGQMSRVDAVNVATMKAAAAKVSLTRSVVASDAFFPFRDGLDAVAAAGATAVAQPGGSMR
ncbi:MAG TPA: bifunctional phosphoribosylaminoimidazolecarboxamide formyltransferase/IMP cyclohydrolase, partial [Vicinamibacterales bacterium]|nr:bifunctional phosphoribosylaminoimidazolecarboxamide formyltransferase/IMP cyclohydrolase [Vicinamibacterales bacterium]